MCIMFFYRLLMNLKLQRKTTAMKKQVPLPDQSIM